MWKGRDAGFITDSRLVSPMLLVNATAPFVVKFSHAFAFESSGTTAFDGGVIEFSADGGATWADVLSLGVNPGYVAGLALGGGNPLEGRPAFAGRQPTFPALQPVTMNFGTQLAGKSVQLRFRIGTDVGGAEAGWLIDDIDVSGIDNTPFTAFVPESQVCAKRASIAAESEIEAVRAAPTASLASFDSALCILRDNQ